MYSFINDFAIMSSLIDIVFINNCYNASVPKFRFEPVSFLFLVCFSSFIFGSEFTAQASTLGVSF